MRIPITEINRYVGIFKDKTGPFTYISLTSFSVTSDQTEQYLSGRRIIATVTAGTIFGTIQSAVFTTVTTVTVTWDSTQLDVGLSAVSVEEFETPDFIEYAVATGTDTYAITLSPAPTKYLAGMKLLVRFKNANSINTPSLNVNTLGAKTLIRNGANLYVGDIKAGGIYEIEYNGVDFVVLNPSLVGTNELIDASVTTAKIADSAITPTKIANSAITPSKMSNGGKELIKAWVNFAGTSGAINAQFNVTSVVRNGAGDYTITLNTPMPDANYTISGFAKFDETGIDGNVPIVGLRRIANNPTTTSFRIHTNNGVTPTDSLIVTITVVGN
jgi:hypothetical protein